MLPDIMIIYLVYASPNSMLFLKGVVMDIVSLHSNSTVTKIRMDVRIVRKKGHWRNESLNCLKHI